MADIQSTTAAGGGDTTLQRTLLILAAIYWLVAGVVVFNAYARVDQTQSHRLDSLSQDGLLTGAGKLDRKRVAALAAEAQTNRACWDAHPKPPGEPEPWFPPDCGVYLPEEAAADAEAATWAADHPGSNVIAAWAAARHVLVRWTLVFGAICGAGLGISFGVRSLSTRLQR